MELNTGQGQGSSSNPRAVAVAAYSPGFCGGLGLVRQHLLLRLTALLAFLAVHALPLLSALALGSLSRRRRLRVAALGKRQDALPAHGRPILPAAWLAELGWLSVVVPAA